ncbi:hypothetical protein HPP92_025575 [Vanilla planifolia]|uniref:Uncharacterized protein n=1 Tax=Vanilla planifolia TaxID=51239 RepID=A0A835PIP9_VANPL|nr:hypothetical protein HPP92_025575 [Vanilla planifolia]
MKGAGSRANGDIGARVATAPTTKAETKAPADTTAARPVRSWPVWRAATEAKRSGAPLPRASSVTAAIEGERRRRKERRETAGEKRSEAARARR